MVGHSFQNYDRVYAGFSAVYTCSHMLSMGLKPIYTTIYNAYIRIFKWPRICVNSGAVICEINAQIYASYKDPYIRVLKCAYTRVSQITLYMPARKGPFVLMAYSCMTAMKIILTRNRQYGGSCKMSCLGLSVF